jgi:predicted phosphodiesterase
MHLAVLADIHGNLTALEAVLADLAQFDADGIIVAGDHLTHGPNPAETIRLLRSLNARMIRGNTDNRLLSYDAGDVPDAWYVSHQWAALRGVHQRLDRASLDWIASMPGQCVVALDGTSPIRVVHGSLQSPSEHLFPDAAPVALHLFGKAGLLPPDGNLPRLAQTLDRIEETVLICGHSHIPWQQEEGDRLALDPGAVGAPLGDVRAQYALLTWQGDRWCVTHRAVPYDVDRVRTAYRESGLLDIAGAATRAFLLGIETGEAVLGHFASHVQRLATQAGHEGCAVVPADTWNGQSQPLTGIGSADRRTCERALRHPSLSTPVRAAHRRQKTPKPEKHNDLQAPS